MIRSHKKTIYEILGRESVHPFPARMAPGIALELVANASKPLRVLDPMAGSGTVLAVARSKGHYAVGLDIDPLAVLISKVWTTTIDVERVRESANAILDRARISFKRSSSREAYPPGANAMTKKFIRYWFDEYARRQLSSLALAIRRIRDDDVQDVLWCAFSRLIISKQSGASLAMDLSHSRPHKAFERAPAKPFPNFLAVLERVVSNCIQRNASIRGPAARVQCGDARALPLEDHSIDLVLTSPPYLNAIDYLRCSKFSLVWMGHNIDDLRQLRSRSIGSEAALGEEKDATEIRGVLGQLRLRPALASRQESILVRYISDMRQSMREVSRVLVAGGKAVYVVGENTVRGTYIPNSAIVSAVAELSGLKFVDRKSRALPADRRYLPPPVAGSGAAAMDGRMRREVILAFSKPS